MEDVHLNYGKVLETNPSYIFTDIRIYREGKRCVLKLIKRIFDQKKINKANKDNYQRRVRVCENYGLR